MKYKYDIVALGDINLDSVVIQNLPTRWHSLATNGIIFWEEINEIPGGSGLNFCVFAKEIGYNPFLLSKIGNDVAGSFIARWLKQKKVQHYPNWISKAATGRALIMRDSSDIRLLINNKANANHTLNLNDVEENKAAIASCRVLYISGYSISEPETPRYQAALMAMKFAKLSPNPPIIVFDVVPHRIYERLTFKQFRKHTQNVDILISDVSTMRRFLNIGDKSESINYKMAMDTAKKISKYYSGLALRFGESGCDNQVLVNKQTGGVLYQETGHQAALDKRGYGDRLALIALRDFFNVLPKRKY